MISNSSVQPDLHHLDHEKELCGTSSPFSAGMLWVGAALRAGVLATLTAARGVCVASCSGGNPGKQGGCAWRLGSGPFVPLITRNLLSISTL